MRTDPNAVFKGEYENMQENNEAWVGQPTGAGCLKNLLSIHNVKKIHSEKNMGLRNTSRNKTLKGFRMVGKVAQAHNTSYNNSKIESFAYKIDTSDDTCTDRRGSKF